MANTEGQHRTAKREFYQDRTRKPDVLSVQAEGIPAELRERPQWVSWRLEWVVDNNGKGKWDKPPIDAKTGRKASSTNPTTWATYDEAFAFYQSGKADGIGCVFAADDPYTGIDLDDAIDAQGRLLPWAVPIVNDLDTYAEISPSGTGCKLWIIGRLPEACLHKKKYAGGEIEVYDSGRYFTVVGHRLPDAPKEIGERQGQLDALLVNAGFLKTKSKTTTASANGKGPLNDAELIAKAIAGKNGAKFSRLWRGDISEYNGDDSRADLALCCMLAFWTGGNPERIDRLFRQSGLMREKWERSDYRERTIAKAIEGTTEFFCANSHKARRRSACSSLGLR